MSGVKRFSWNGLYGMEELADGDYVLHSDHEAEVARLRAEVEKVRGYEVAPLEAKVAELRVELADAHAAIESKAGWEWKKEADRLRAELQNAAKAALDAVALSCEKEREADALRVDAERYRWLREKAYMLEGMGPAVILAESDFPIDDHRTEGFVFHGELDKAIDAAMGASA